MAMLMTGITAPMLTNSAQEAIKEQINTKIIWIISFFFRQVISFLTFFREYILFKIKFLYNKDYLFY